MLPSGSARLVGIFVQLLTLVLYSTASPAHHRRGDCVWQEPLVSFSCTPYDVSTKIPGISRLTVSAFGAVTIKSLYLPDVFDAAKAAMGVYQAFLDGKLLNIEVFVGDALLPGFPSAYGLSVTPRKPSAPNTCQIQIITRDVTQTSEQRTEIRFMQTLAHELYHCVQQLRTPGSMRHHDFARWWIEGTATYFANRIFPTGPNVQTEMELYQPKVPLYLAKDDGDTAAIFFQYLSSKWSDQRIDAWTAKQKYVNSYPEERSRISLDPDLTDNFPGFATAFLDNMIADSDNEKHLIESPFIVDAPAINFDVPAPTGQTPHVVKLTVRPWIIKARRKTTFKSRQAVSLAFDIDGSSPHIDDGTVLQYRQTGDKIWKSLRNGKHVVLQKTAEPECPIKNSVEWEFLVTSTSDPALDTLHDERNVIVRLSFIVKDSPTRRDDTCNPSPSAGSPGQCLVGNWNLDIPSMQAFLSSVLSKSAGTGGATITNTVVTGSSTFSITSVFVSTMTFSNLAITYDGDAQGIAFHTDIDISGSVTGTLVDVRNAIITGGDPALKDFTWSNAVSTGNAHTNTSIPSLGAALPLDVPLSGQYGNTTVVQYECSGTVLKTSGYVGGKFTWAYTWAKS